MENMFMNKPTGKDHKFFERYLDNNLPELAEFLQNQYSNIETLKLSGVTKVTPRDHWLSSDSVSTIKWREYNVFQFYHPSIYKLYKNISETIKEACEYYEVDFDKQEYMVQGWFNINYNNSGKLDWHDHGGPYAPYFHGYYCVNAEPSVTYYRVFDKETDNHNKNNRMIISEMGHPHAMGSWDWEGPRVTIAYDIVPLKSLIANKAEPQHWIPLL
jgi:hypothetical protein